MPANLAKPRAFAFRCQSGRCYYCDYPLLSGPVEPFAARFGISVAQAKLLRCTGEHLKPREEGGTNARINIVAACWFCNSRRHARPSAPNPDRYKQLVRKRVRQGRWHSFIFRFASSKTK